MNARLPTSNEIGTQGFKNYLEVRDKVVKILNGVQDRAGSSKPSDYWTEELAGFEYMFEASPLLINKLKHQSYHITGLKVYDYRSSQTGLKMQLESKLKELKKADSKGLFIAENPALGGFGHQLSEGLANIDTLKFYESLIALDKAQILDQLKSAHRRALVAEVGSGWGGFAYQFKKTVPNCTYVLIDFPELFLFSATYLKTVFPGCKCLFVDSEAERLEFEKNSRSYDFVFLPQDLFNSVWKVPLDLAINMVSFQEMTTVQVRNYVKKFSEVGVKWLYSHNRDRSKHNHQLSAVSEILSENYELQSLRFMSGAYTDLKAKFLGQEGGQKLKVPGAKKMMPMTNFVQKALVNVPKLREKLKGAILMPEEKELLKRPVADQEQNLKLSDATLHWSEYRHLIAIPKMTR